VLTDTPWLLGGLLAVLATVAVVDTVRERAVLFDERLTANDRQKLVRLALFVLVPLSVLAHEAGHAVAVRAFGGRIVDFGFYLFYGFVAHEGLYSALELAWIAVAGTLVNVVVGLTALALAWFRPRRAALNYLLFVFGALELGNALIFYPVLDALGGVAGDWETIYSRDTPVFSVVVGLVHVALLAAGVVVWRNPGFQRGYLQRTGRSMAAADRTSGPDAGDGAGAHPEQQELSGILAVAAAVASNDWRHPVHLMTDAQAGGSQVVLRWESGGFQRALLVHATYSDDPEQHVELHAAVQSDVDGVRAPAYQRALARIDGRPTAQELVPYVRRFLDFVDTWDGSTVVSPN
jgi:hypothetical protein